MSVIDNPFINKVNLVLYDEIQGKNVDIDQKNVSKYYDSVFLLVKKTNETIPSDFYGWQVPTAIYNDVTSKLLIHKVSVNILKNKTHFDSAIIMSKEQLGQFNIFNYELFDKNIVVPIFNISYQNILHYVEQYESSNTLQNIYNTKVINKYFNVDDNHKSIEYFSNMINNLDSSDYWTNYYNCLMNITNNFKKRSITIQTTRLSDSNIAKIVEQFYNDKTSGAFVSMASNKKENYNLSPDELKSKKNKKKTKSYGHSTDGSNNNYLKDLESDLDNSTESADSANTTNTDESSKYVDISSVNKKGNGFYKINPKSEFTYNDINQLFSVLDRKSKFMLLCNMMVSKKYCHLVVNNIYVLEQMQDEMKLFAPLFRYLMSYAWIRFYLEECIKKSYVKTDDEFIFNINTASKLPIFPFNHSKPKENPYMPILVSDEELKASENLCGIPEYINTDHNNNGICNFDEFQIRMNIFCTGDPNHNLFEGVDFKKNKIGISGSIITACVQKQHPLMTRFANCNSLKEKFTNYFNEYYAKSDIDVMFLTNDNYTFVDRVYEFYNQLVLNICKINSKYAEPSHIKLILNKLDYLFVSEEFINENIKLDGEITDKIKYVTEHINDKDIKDKFLPFYEKARDEKYSQLLQDFSENEKLTLKSRYPDIFTTKDIDFKIYINKTVTTTSDTSSDEEVTSSKFKDIDVSFSIKYKISSPYLNHYLELFPIKYNDFFSVVSKFHLPCVRGYYDGSNVYLTPSCISSHLTYMNLDYKYVTGTNDPINIINKYRMRGFGTWLNTNEKKLVTKYSRMIPFWNNLYTIDSKLSDSDASVNIYGILSLNHKLFRPRLYNMDEYTESMFVETSNRYNDSQLPQTLLNSTITTTQMIINKMKSLDIKQINYDKFMSINRDGNIIPLQKWIISNTWNIYESNYKHFDKAKSSVKSDSNDTNTKSILQNIIVKKKIKNINNIINN